MMKRAMVLAPKLLFAASLVLLVLGFVLPLLIAFQARASNLYANAGTLDVIIPALVGGIGSAVWPFFGAAFLYRLDKWMVASMPSGAVDD